MLKNTKMIFVLWCLILKTFAGEIVCDHGKYLYNNICFPCPIGYKCYSNELIPCERGTFQRFYGQYICNKCPDGTYDGRNSEQLESVVCIDCPSGYFCTNGAIRTCRLGATSYGSTKHCHPCNNYDDCQQGEPPIINGTLCDLSEYYNNGNCIACPDGYGCYEKLDGLSYEITKCPDFEVSPVGQFDCFECKQGTYFENNGCVPCPSGMACDNMGEIKTCETGYFSIEGDPNCRKCPWSHYCPNPTQIPLKCRAGFSAIPGSTDCILIPENYALNANGKPYLCSDNQFSPPGADKCFDLSLQQKSVKKSRSRRANCGNGEYESNGKCYPCRPGKYCDGSSTPAVEKSCNSGQYSGFGQAQCSACADLTVKVCPSNPDFETKETDLVTCEPGKYAMTNRMGCNTCEAGKYCPGNNLELECPIGMFSEESSSHCETCTAGSQANNDKTECIICETDEVSFNRADVNNDSEKNKCFKCPAGFTCSNRNAYFNIQCRNGYYSLEGDTTCTVCPAGNACPKMDESPTLCPAGTYSIQGQTFCSPIPAGFELQNNDLKICQSGYYSIDPTLGCVECDLDYYCPSVASRSLPCPPGRHTDQRGQTKCKICDAGNYCPGDSPMRLCPDGTFSAEGQSECSPCSAGYRCNEGSTSATENICPAGSYCPLLLLSGLYSVIDVPCPDSTYQPYTGKTSFTDCLPCPSGKICETNTPDDCPIGYYCPGVSFSDDWKDTGLEANPDDNQLPTEKVPCPPGTHSRTTGLISRNECSPCPAGKYCSLSANGRSTDSPCPVNHYCPEGHVYDDPDEPSIPCPPGYSSNGVGELETVQDCTICPAGSYCEAGNDAVNCPAGTYRSENGGKSLIDCIITSQGKRASTDVGAESDASSNCLDGRYCPPGTISGKEPLCPPGTYNDKAGQWLAEQCKPCSAGTYCSDAGRAFDGDSCPAGHFCPERSIEPKENPCARGTYRSTSGAKCQTISVDCDQGCEACPEGKYCDDGTIVPKSCPSGHFCLESTAYFNQYPCINGTYNSDTDKSAQSDCLPCYDGYWCGLGFTTPVSCPAGRYYEKCGPLNSPVSDECIGARQVDDCGLCPAGKFCPGETVVSNACDLGQYSKSGARECSFCIAGHFCDDTDGTSFAKMIENICPAGKFCPTGSKSATLDCAPGYYCPAGIDQMLKCFPGTFRVSPGAGEPKDCTSCPAGYWCDAGMHKSPVLDESYLCSAGHYCPINIILNPYLSETDLDIDGSISDALNRTVGSFSKYQVPCMAGTYRSLVGGENQLSCTTCSSGSYCPIGNTDEISCPNGYYCPEGSSFPLPCPKGTYHDVVSNPFLESVDECTDCLEKHYCDGEGMIEPRGECDFGYLCYEGASISNPNDGSTGEECPAGGFCPAGSSEVEPCLDGTYSNATRQISLENCVKCRPGTVCDASSGGLTEPSSGCPSGYFCELGSKSVDDECPVGTFCIENSSVSSNCPIGTFQPETGKSTCEPCNSGALCQTFGLFDPSVNCPAGSFCPSPFKFDQEEDYFYTAFLPASISRIGSFTSKGIFCPPGTYSDGEKQEDSTACQSCPAGKYCFIYGATSETYEVCADGYVCTEGNVYKTPNGPENGIPDSLPSSYSGPCPTGHYCPAGSSMIVDPPEACPKGTYNPYTRLTSQDDCLTCLAGYSCTLEGLSQPDKTCEAGYFCEPGSVTPTAESCAVGHYCPAGASQELTCPTGFYQDETTTEICKPCPAGRICQDSTDVNNFQTECPEGYYCLGTTNNLNGVDLSCSCTNKNEICGGTDFCREEKYPTPCPRGTYGDSIGLTSESQCKKCLGGRYCDRVGLKSSDLESRLIGRGHYSAGGALVKYPIKSDDCQDLDCGLCDKGHYCQNEGSSSPNETPCATGTFSNIKGMYAACPECPPSFHCSTTGIVTLDDYECEEGFYCENNNKNSCTAKHHCPVGSSEPIVCPPGKFCPAGVSNGETCSGGNVGVYCGGGDENAQECPDGNRCDEDGLSTPKLCQPGSYQSERGKKVCTSCDQGKYCSLTGLSSPDGECYVGYNCEEGQKESGLESFICPTGNYRNSSTTSCQECPSGFWCPDLGMETPFNCVDGSLCVDGEFVNCEEGSFCVQGDQMLCPAGTYRKTTSAYDADQCIVCPAGFLCNEVYSLGSTIIPTDCPASYFCALETTDVDSNNECPTGFYCPTGSPRPIPCPIGAHCPNTLLESFITCDEGSLCNEIEQTEQKNCPEGHFCQLGSKIKCPMGTYDNTSSKDKKTMTDCVACPKGQYAAKRGSIKCLDCTNGFDCTGGCVTGTPKVFDGANNHCTSASLDLVDTSEAFNCPKGYYCESGEAGRVACPSGTYNDKIGAYSEEFCLDCPLGVKCDEATGDLITNEITCPPGKFCLGTVETDCGEGYYCNESNSYPIPCPIGYYGSNATAASIEDCIICDAGKYCNRPGLSGNDVAVCFDGFYCDEGSTTPMQNRCPVGWACRNGLKEQCATSTYTSSTNQLQCVSCPARHFCTNGLIASCPAGKYCPAGVEIGDLCPAGYWSNVEFLESASECMLCPAGYICSTSGIVSELDMTVCPAGYWCQSGVSTEDLADAENTCNNNREHYGRCTAGYKCPAGSSKPALCPAGTYQTENGQADCSTCDAGEFCHAGSSIIDNLVRGNCPAGYFCPAETVSKYENPCTQGTFNSLTGEDESAICEPCTAGSYCNQEGLSTVSGSCTEGYYCPEGSKTSTEKRCGVGNYCPEMSVDKLECPFGKFCPSRTMTKADVETDQFNCWAGYYCVEGQSLPNPSSGRCNYGHYCPAGIQNEESCPEFTYNDQRLATGEDDCKLCPPGYDCTFTIDHAGPFESYTRPCPTGHFCTDGEPVDCDAGHKCPEGSAYQTPCSAGYYQTDSGADSCDVCEMGFYCDLYEDNSGGVTPIICPAGYFCNEGTQFKYELACPVGTVRESEGAESDQQCNLCTKGNFCINQGQSVVSAKCSPGYICTSGSTVPSPQYGQAENPIDGDENYICPRGHFCPFSGSDCPTDGVDPETIGWKGSTEHGDNECVRKCSPGYYNDKTGATSIEACKTCNNKCDEYGLEIDGLCTPGIDCSTNAPCMSGYYCPADTLMTLACPLGTYMLATTSGAELVEACLDCEEGRFCPKSGLSVSSKDDLLVCDADGFYCGKKVQVNRPSQFVCPLGSTCLAGVLETCPVTETTLNKGSTECHVCPDGFSCENNADGTLAFCNEGYCKGGIKLPCPAGALARKEGISIEAECSVCPSGYDCDGTTATPCATDYCRSGGTASVTTSCQGRIYVDRGKCPEGFKCPGADAEPIPCEPGFYSDENHVSECIICESSYHCPLGTSHSSMLQQKCPVGYYCPSGTKKSTEFPCPKGTLGESQSLDDANKCSPCPSGQYCEKPGSSIAKGDCSAGYTCAQGVNATLSTPKDNECGVGYYCDEATGDEGLLCEPGHFCPIVGLIPDDMTSEVFQCAEGYVCGLGVLYGRPTQPDHCVNGVNCGGLCPPGHYCERGTALHLDGTDESISCADGTYYKSTGAREQNDCIPCLGGYQCNWSTKVDSDSSDPTTSDECPAGSYCQDGEAILCPAGYYCANTGMPLPRACPPGTYQPSNGKVDCLICPAGKFCSDTQPIEINAQDNDEIACPIGYYCPSGTYHSNMYPCSLGRYGEETGRQSETQCATCWTGKACDHLGLTEDRKEDLPDCASGYICPSGASHVIDGDICEFGYFCTAGIIAYSDEYKCPLNTYGKNNGLQSSDQCSFCPGEKYCNEKGLTESDLDEDVYTCTPNNFCNPGIQNAIQPCLSGYFCVGGNAFPAPCDIGEYQPATGQDKCLPCSAGKICNSRSEKRSEADLELCPPGWYCKPGSYSTCSPEYHKDTCTSEIQLCPIGKHCPQGSSEPLPCKDGFYALARGQSECDLCSAGIICDVNQVTENEPYKTCPEGRYCSEGTSTNGSNKPLDCPPGTYSTLEFITNGSNLYGLMYAKECSPCPGGYYCTGSSNVPQKCDQGYYCQFAVRSADQTALISDCDSEYIFPSIGGECQPGYGCDVDTINPVQKPCPAGTFSVDGTICATCDAGYWCPAQVSSIDNEEYYCPAGYYCLEGSSDYRNTPCPLGTYSEDTKLVTKERCKSCEPGKFCPSRATTIISNNDCAAGHFCGGGSVEQSPMDNLENNFALNGFCTAGTFCKSGAASITDCEAGQVCPHAFLDQSFMACPAGFFCPAGSVEIKTLCSPGYFCQEATPRQFQCLSNTLDEGVGLKEEDECQACPSGFTCENGNKNECENGRKCVNGDTLDCPAGHYCSSNNPYEIPCNIEEYKASSGTNTVCDTCPEEEDCTLTPEKRSQNCYIDIGNVVCEDTVTVSYGVSSPEDCPIGYYCTNQGKKRPCEPGTYGSSLRRGQDCSDKCGKGYFCASYGNTQKVGDGVCGDGFYCDDGSKSRTESVCEAGSYCTNGIASKCSAGTYTNASGSINEKDCLLCEPGKYCKQGESQACEDGTICKGGDTDSKGDKCDLASQCEIEIIDGIKYGAVVQIDCPVGTYKNRINTGCLPCEKETYCPAPKTENPLPCELGSSCLDSTGYIESADGCPIGKYMNTSATCDDLTSEDCCLLCEAGESCSEYRSIRPTDSCHAGFFCPEGSVLPTTSQCSAGQYCAQSGNSADVGIQCQAGTYFNQQGADSGSYCTTCPGGWICTQAGLSFPDLQCPVGKFCTGGLKNLEEASECPVNFYCPAGSSTPRPCSAGKYQPNQSQAGCEACPSGNYCLGTSKSFDTQAEVLPIICPAYSYCPEGSSSPHTCGKGRYTDDSVTSLERNEDCTLCPAGKYCRGGRIAGGCAAGYHCKSGNSSPTPTQESTDVGTVCPIGYICPAGTINPEKCLEGLVISMTGARSQNQCNLCSQGHYCPLDNDPVQEIVCPRGHYCPYGRTNSASYIPCPRGTYSDKTENINLMDCYICPAGYYCDLEGIADIRQHFCPKGYYCPKGSGAISSSIRHEPVPCSEGTFGDMIGLTVQNECTKCPASFYCPSEGLTSEEYYKCQPGTLCPAGSARNYTCPAGFYCPETLYMVTCKAGYYCEGGNENEVICPKGSYCPFDNINNVGCMRPIKCPAGFANRMSLEGDEGSEIHYGTTLENTCAECPAGHKSSDDRGECIPCRAGVICLPGALDDNPMPRNQSLATMSAYQCPPGYYCPEGNEFPIGCPAGKFSSNEGYESESSCRPCPVDYFNHLTGQTSCLSCGGQAKQPNVGSPRCNCFESGREFQPSDRQCVCRVGYREDPTASNACVKYIYPICRTGTFRNENGDCLEKSEFESYCNTICDAGDFLSFDKATGICNCKQPDLEEVCDIQCRKKINNVNETPLRWKCQNGIPQLELKIGESNNSYKSYDLLDQQIPIINSNEAMGSDRCSSEAVILKEVFLMESNSQGILGGYEITDFEAMETLLDNTLRVNSSNPLIRIKRQATQTILSGIQNPAVCLNVNSIVAFIISIENYPIYDYESVLNSNDNFDYGGFRALDEIIGQMEGDSELFTFSFDDPGTYVFYMKNDKNTRFYIKVSGNGAECMNTGPFFPSTSQYYTRMGIGIDEEIALEPDWLMFGIIFLVLIFVLIIIVISLMLFRKYGWTKKLYEMPFYRDFNSFTNFDMFSSKGERSDNKKFIDEILNTESKIDEKELCKFWDNSRNIDLDEFDVQRLYRILMDQSINLASGLNNQKEEAKGLIGKFKEDVNDLKSAWAQNLDFDSMMTEEEKTAYHNTKIEIENEIQRRQNLGLHYGRIYKEIENRFTDMFDVEKSQISSFNQLVNKVFVLFDAIVNNVDQNGIFSELCDFNNLINFHIKQMYNLFDEYYMSCSNQSLTGKFTGMHIAVKKENSIFNAELHEANHDDIFNEDGDILLDCLVKDDHTGLITVKKGTKMMKNNQVETIAGNSTHFLHPRTHLVYPILDNVLYNTDNHRFIITVDAGVAFSNPQETQFLPFIPYPDLPEGIEIDYLSVSSTKELRFGQKLVDKETGLAVPILAITINPTSGIIYPLGGTIVSNITNLATPIELDLIHAKDISTYSYITGVNIGIDGLINPRFSQNIESNMVNGDLQVQPMLNTELIGNNGTYIAFRKNSMSACMVRLIDNLEKYHEYIGTLINGSDGSVGSELDSIKKQVALANLHYDRSMTIYVTTLGMRSQRLKFLSEKMDYVEKMGGVSGVFSQDGGTLPILIGYRVKSDEYDDLVMPILDIEIVPGKCEPLYGTLSDFLTGDTKAIDIGTFTVQGDQEGRVIGAKRSIRTNVVNPIIQSGTTLEVAKPPSGAISELENQSEAISSSTKNTAEYTRSIYFIVNRLLYTTGNIGKSVVQESIKSLETYINEIEAQQTILSNFKIESLSKVASRDVLFQLESRIGQQNKATASALKQARKVSSILSKVTDYSTITRLTIENDIKQEWKQFENMLCDLEMESLETRTGLFLAKKRLFIENSTRCETGLYYHGVFVSSNTFLLDEIIPLLRKLEKNLKDDPFYLTNEVVHVLETNCNSKKDKRSNIHMKQQTSDTSSSPSSSSDSDNSTEIDLTKTADINARLKTDNLIAKLRIKERQKLEALVLKHDLERKELNQKCKINVVPGSPSNSDLMQMKTELDEQLVNMGERQAKEKENLLSKLTDENLSEFEKLDIATDLTTENRSMLYGELEALSKQEINLLKEMEDYKDYQEPKYEDLANKLQDLKFEVRSQHESDDETIEKSKEKLKRRKKNRKPASERDVQSTIEQLQLFNDLEKNIKIAEANGDIDQAARDRLISELYALHDHQGLIKKTDDDDIDEQGSGDAFDSWHHQIKSLKNQFLNKMKNINQEEFDDLMKTMNSNQKNLNTQKLRHLRAALIARNAKIARAKQRNAAAEHAKFSAILDTEKDNYKDNERKKILAEISKGIHFEDAVHSVLQKRHKQNQKELVERHQAELKVLENDALDKIQSEKEDEKQKLIVEYSNQLALVKDKDGKKEQELQDQLNQKLTNLNTESEILANRIASKEIGNRKEHQTAEMLALLDEQMMEIQTEIDYFVDGRNDKKLKLDAGARKRQKERLKDENRRRNEKLLAKGKAERELLEKTISEKNTENLLNIELEKQKILSTCTENDKERLLAELEQRSKILDEQHQIQSAKLRAELEERIKIRNQKHDSQLDVADGTVIEETMNNPLDQSGRSAGSIPNYSKLLLESGIVGDLDYLKKLLSEFLKTNPPEKENPIAALFTSSESDPKKGALKIVNPNSLAATEFFVFRYCLRQLQQIQNQFKFDDIRVFITEEIPDLAEKRHQLQNLYIFKSGTCILHRDALKSVGVASVIAAHLSAHIASGETFDDTDALFKRAFFKSATIINGSIPTVFNQNLDFSDANKKVRIEKFKEKLKKQTQNSMHLKQQNEVAAIMQNSMNILKSKNGLTVEPNAIELTVSIPSVSFWNINEVENLYRELEDALQRNDDNQIQKLQKQIDILTAK